MARCRSMSSQANYPADRQLTIEGYYRERKREREVGEAREVEGKWESKRAEVNQWVETQLRLGPQCTNPVN